MINRRIVLIGLASVPIARPLATRAQQQALPEVGYLASYSRDASGQQRLAGFEKGLAEAGYVEGRNVAIEVRWADGHYDRLPALAADLVRLQVKVIVAASTPAALAAKAATTTIPVVFSLSSDPVALGLVSSLARPGGNLTGVTRLNVELGPKRLQLMHEIVPAATSLALLVNPTNPAISEAERRVVEAAALTLGLKLHVLEASDARGIDEAFAIAHQLRAGALIFVADSFFNDQSSQLGALTVRHQIPTIHTYREFVAAGGLMSYGDSLADSNRVAGLYTSRILKGKKPADLPVQQATKIEMFINLKTAKAIGLTIPPDILLRADEVIE